MHKSSQFKNDNRTNRNFWSLLVSSLCWGVCSVTVGCSLSSSSSRGPDPSLSSAGHSLSLLSLLPFLWNLKEKLFLNFCKTLSCWLCVLERGGFWVPEAVTRLALKLEGCSWRRKWETKGIVASARGCSVVTWPVVPSSSSSPDHCRLFGK